MQAQLTLQTKMTQQLTVQMIQHLQLLQMTTVELKDLVEKSFLENPLIELVEHQSSSREVNYKSTRSAGNDVEPQFVQKECVKTFLIEQIPVSLNKQDKQIMRLLIDALDDRLFLTMTTEELMENFRIAPLKAKELIKLLQSFEPVGVGSLNMVQFLCRHIENNKMAPKFAKIFVEKELKAMAKMDVKGLSKKYQVPITEVIDTIHFIKQLPRVPVISLHDVAHFVIPDASILKINGEWLIELEDRFLPEIKLQTIYTEILKQDRPDYYKQCMKDYVALVQGIDFRKKTLYDIIRFIIEEQQSFLEQKSKTLKPLKYKDVAAALDLHESTISRALKGKYICTPLGTMALQDFFVKAVGDTAVTAICNQIAQFIQNEPKTAPYSDQQLVELLQREGIKISRRTVTKYREMQNIPSSHKRIYLNEAQ